MTPQAIRSQQTPGQAEYLAGGSVRREARDAQRVPGHLIEVFPPFTHAVPPLSGLLAALSPGRLPRKGELMSSW